MPDAITAYVMLVMLFACLVSSTIGFAGALISVPLLALRLPATIAVPLQATFSVFVSSLIVLQDWRRIQVRTALPLMACALGGVPLGLMVLQYVRPDNLRLFIGSIVIAFALYSLTLRSRLHLRKDHPPALVGAGFCSGILAAACSMSGPPLVIYGSLRRWSPQHFRATLQSLFLVASSGSLVGYVAKGMWKPAVMHYFLFCLPGVVIAILIGRSLNRRFQSDKFFRAVYVGLIMIGGMLIVQALHLPIF